MPDEIDDVYADEQFHRCSAARTAFIAKCVEHDVAPAAATAMLTTMLAEHLVALHPNDEVGRNKMADKLLVLLKACPFPATHNPYDPYNV